jgi:hypothetical protein
MGMVWFGRAGECAGGALVLDTQPAGVGVEPVPVSIPIDNHCDTGYPIGLVVYNFSTLVIKTGPIHAHTHTQF